VDGIVKLDNTNLHHFRGSGFASALGSARSEFRVVKLAVGIPRSEEMPVRGHAVKRKGRGLSLAPSRRCACWLRYCAETDTEALWSSQARVMLSLEIDHVRSSTIDGGFDMVIEVLPRSFDAS
jgi:hypothetical protein